MLLVVNQILRRESQMNFVGYTYSLRYLRRICLSLQSVFNKEEIFLIISSV